VREGPHDPTQEERDAKLTGLQRLKVINDVFDEGETDPYQRAVDDAVQQSIDLGSAEDHDGDEEQPLGELFDNRRSHSSGEELRRPG
jgi:hypothetical protein